LRRDGLTIILVTHEIGFARRAGRSVVMLCDGRILEQGIAGGGARSPKDGAHGHLPETGDGLVRLRFRATHPRETASEHPLLVIPGQFNLS